MILFHSPKGGSGSTTAAANLALILARRGRDVTVMDLTGQGVLGLYLGGDPDGGDVSTRIVEDRMVVLSGVQLVSVDRRQPAQILLSEILRLESSGRTLIVDVAAGDRTMLDLLLPRAQVRLCVLTPEPAALAVLPQACVEVARAQADPTLFILNRLDDRFRLGRDIAGLFRSLLGEKLLGTIRRDEAVNEAAAMMETLERYAPASAAMEDFNIMADAVLDRLARFAARGLAG